MLKSGKSFSAPTWLKGFGWLAFGILALTTFLVVTRWWVMESGNREARRRVDLMRKNHPPSPPATPSPAALFAETTPGIPLSALPYFGSALSGDRQAWNEFAILEKEILTFLRYKERVPVIADGELSFRAILRNMGVEVPDSMTEEDAAMEYLKQADRFSSLLARWREAVTKGPIHEAEDRGLFSGVRRFAIMNDVMSRLLKMTAQARLRCGDHTGAWADLQAMINANERYAESCHPDGDLREIQDPWTLFVAEQGLRFGAWTGDQMSELSSMIARRNPIGDMRRNQEAIKKSITSYYANFEKNKDRFTDAYLSTPSHFDRIANRMKLKLITTQQIRDNMELELAEADRLNNLFDPETGFFLRGSQDTENQPIAGDGKAHSSDSFYFMIRDLRAPHNRVLESVLEDAEDLIWSQVKNDHFRLALALETYRQKTGSHPDHLESVSDQFPAGPPLDIATGQPYFYQKNPEGGYTLWGTGIDGKSDGGNQNTDMTWRHRPVKSK